MDRSRGIAAGAVVTCLLRMVEHEPAFVPAPLAATNAAAVSQTGRTGNLRALSGARATSSSTGTGFVGIAGAALAIGAVSASARKAARKQAGARARTQVLAVEETGSGLVGSGPVVAYTKALMDAAAKKDEQVVVAQDVMQVKAKFFDENFLDELQFIANETGVNEFYRGQETAKLLGPFQSTVVPKFIVFLSKKKRLQALKQICQEFVAELYRSESIAPVKVRCAARLSEDQLEAIKEKMKAKTGSENIKLIVEVDAGLLGGFVVEWGYPDPEDLNTPTDGIDLSLKNVLSKAALGKGVLVDV